MASIVKRANRYYVVYTATSGQVIVDGNDITAYNRKQLIGYRRTDIGFVFQFYNVVPNLTALENVELAVQVCKNHLDPAETLEKVGFGDRMGSQYSLSHITQLWRRWRTG